jgi:hypothetical protein
MKLISIFLMNYYNNIFYVLWEHLVKFEIKLMSMKQVKIII